MQKLQNMQNMQNVQNMYKKNHCIHNMQNTHLCRLCRIRVPLIAQSWNPGLEEVETQGGNGRAKEGEKKCCFCLQNDLMQDRNLSLFSGMFLLLSDFG